MKNYNLAADPVNNSLIKMAKNVNLCHFKYNFHNAVNSVSSHVQTNALNNMLKKYNDVFQPPNVQSKVTHPVQHYIETTGPPASHVHAACSVTNSRLLKMNI